MLPSGTEQVLITFDEVSVHRTGGGWISLPLAQDPYTIDLSQFSDGTTPELAPPVSLISGKYTQIRIGVTEAFSKINGDEYPVEIPSDNLKTDKEFDFEVVGGGAVDLTVDFDLSQSIVATGEDTYKLKPVLHIMEAQEAATIQGEILKATFENFNSPEAIVVVTFEDEEYTRVVVEKGPDSTQFSIFWLVPESDYKVLIDLDGQFDLNDDQSFEYTEMVSRDDLPVGAIFELNGGAPINL